MDQLGTVENRPCLEGGANKISLACRWGRRAGEKCRPRPSAPDRAPRGMAGGRRVTHDSSCMSGEDQELNVGEQRAGGSIHEWEIPGAG